MGQCEVNEPLNNLVAIGKVNSENDFFCELASYIHIHHVYVYLHIHILMHV